MMVSIMGLNRALVLRALYDAAKPQGLGFQHYTPTPMTAQEASDLLAKYDYFDYVKGRVLKVKLGQDADEFDERLYDRDNGPGAAARAIASLRS